VYHKVVRGETLWRISKWYGVRLEDLVAANRLSDARLIKVGQTLFIPKAKEQTGKKLVARETDDNPFMWPLEGKIIEYFGTEHHLIKNKGLDIMAKDGDTVRAARGGTVIFCSDEIKGYKKTVVIDHGDTFQTVYAYNSDLLVKKGDRVKQSDMIARAGRPMHSPIAVLHFEIRKKGEPQDPLHYLPLE